MKKILITGAFIINAILSNAQNNTGRDCNLGITINNSYSKALVLDSLLQQYTTNALPGAAMAVYTEREGWWASAKGYASLENKSPMENCNLQYLQSVSKTYIAVAMLKLKEQGKIDFDDPITKYLHVRYSKYVKDAEKITVRMLLNHRSGIPEYNSNPGFVASVLMHPASYFTGEDCLKTINGEGLQFTPGSKYKYANTNYLLLSLIEDSITGDHAAFIKKIIFEPLGLGNTYYANNHSYLNGLNLPASYWDVLNENRPVNITRLQVVSVASSKGDDGIVCTPADAVKFLKGLIEGKLLSPASMKEMFDFVKDEKGNDKYGMGMFYFDLGGITAYGHGGGGIGAGCGLLYIPSHKTYLFISTNLGVIAGGNLAEKADELKNKILLSLLQ